MTLLKNICVKLNKLKLNKLAGLLRNKQLIFYRYLLAYVYKPLKQNSQRIATLDAMALAWQPYHHQRFRELPEHMNKFNVKTDCLKREHYSADNF